MLNGFVCGGYKDILKKYREDCSGGGVLSARGLFERVLGSFSLIIVMW